MSSALEYCIVEDMGRVRLVTINRPQVMNALPTQASHEMEGIWNEFAARDDLWVGIVTGAGQRAFCAGNDLKIQAAGKRGQRAHTGFGGLTGRFDLDKPIIAAVNGYAMGGGFELALACDIIIASMNARFALPEPRRGIIAGAGGVHRLMRAIPQKQAMGMILTGRQVTAEEGLALGFVNEVVPEGEAVSAALRWADDIMECSPLAIRASKEAIRRGLDEPTLETAVRTRYPVHASLYESEDYVEGPKAFAEKRSPVWKNR